MSVSKNEQLRSLLKDTVMLMCKSVAYEQNLRIEALVGVTIDSKEVILVGFNELLGSDREGGVKSQSSGEAKTHSSGNSAKNVTGKDATNSKQMVPKSTKVHQQGKEKRNIHEQSSDVIICDEPSFPNRMRDKNGTKAAKRQHKDDDLIYVGEESYSLVTGNFVKEEQLAAEPPRTGRKGKPRGFPSQTRVRMQNVQAMSQNAAVPSAGNGWTAMVQQSGMPSDPGRKHVGVRKRARKNQYPRYSVVDTSGPVMVPQSGHSNGMTENRDVHVVNSAPDFSAILGTPLSQAQCQPTYTIATPDLSAIRSTPRSRPQNQAAYNIATHATSSTSNVQPVHVTTSTPIRDTNHVSWMTPISQASADNELTAVNHVSQVTTTRQGDFIKPEPQFVVMATSNMPTFTNTSPYDNQDNFDTIPASQCSHPLTPITQETPVNRTDPGTTSATVSQTDHGGMPNCVTNSASSNQLRSATMSAPTVNQTDTITSSEPGSQCTPPSVTPVVTTSESVKPCASSDASSTVSQTDPGTAGTTEVDLAASLDEPEKPSKKRRVNGGRKASPATCPVCEKVVQGIGMLRRHMKQKHPDLVK